MKTWESGGIAVPFLTSVLEESEWSASRPAHFTPASAVEKRKILHCQESNPGRPAHRPSLQRLSYPDSLIKTKGRLKITKSNVKLNVYYK
jgi:hypothetical protein